MTDYDQTAQKTVEENSYSPDKQAEFLRERIKQKTVNKKKLVRRTLITVSMAAIFGLVACLVFLLLEPVISNMLYPTEVKQQISLPDEEDEIHPGDLYADDDEMMKEVQEEEIAKIIDSALPTQTVVMDYSFGIEDYQVVYTQMRSIGTEAKRSLVTVSVVTTDVDGFYNPYENQDDAVGIIVATNNVYYYILVNRMGYDEAEQLRVTFHNGASATANYIGMDEQLGYSILSVSCATIAERYKNSIKAANLGSSNVNYIQGLPIIAVGRFSAGIDDMSFGFVTSGENFSVTDATYRSITTDIYGTKQAGGVLVNVYGRVIGIIDQNRTGEAGNHVLSAIGISELKRVIERISNEEPQIYLGIQGEDVGILPQSPEIPEQGVYVVSVEIDSPALGAGIQSGDILVSVNEQPLLTYATLVSLLQKAEAEQEWNIELLRYGADGYTPVSVMVTLGKKE